MGDIITDVRAAIDRVVEGGARKDDVLTTIGIVDRLKELTRELSAKSEAAILAWIEQNGDIESGEVRYYAGTNKTVRCRDHDGTVQAILAATGGDVSAVAKCLASSAWKHAACRELLPADEYESLFELKETLDLKTGKPVRRVQKFDGRFHASRGLKRAGDGGGTGGVDQSGGDAA